MQEVKLMYNKKIPEDDRAKKMKEGKKGPGWNVRDPAMKVLRREARNAVFLAKDANGAIAIHTAARTYIRRNKLPLAVVKRGRLIFIITEEKKKAMQRERETC